MIRQVISTLQKPSTLRTSARIWAAGPIRTLVVKSPGPDPLEVLRKECVNRKLCDRMGYRQPGVHWAFSVAMAPTPELGHVAPNLRTVGIQRVSPAGIDFVMKKGCKTSEALAMEQPLSMLFTQGKYVPGQKAEQWRGEGRCVTIDLEEILHCLPHYTITGMVVSKKIEKEGLEKNDDLHSDVSVVRVVVELCFFHIWTGGILISRRNFVLIFFFQFLCNG
jgi:hypothetical protein